MIAIITAKEARALMNGENYIDIVSNKIKAAAQNNEPSTKLEFVPPQELINNLKNNGFDISIVPSEYRSCIMHTIISW